MNENHATFEDIMALIELVKNTVHERHGVQLEEEVRIIR
jgi:UDP-N-acetylenolpyruvoylglucosamine reductase